MASIVTYYSRGRHPKRFWGKRALKAMNGPRHAAMPEWVMPQIQVREDARVLDVGCGGGANVARLIAKCPKGVVTGLDISAAAIEMTKELNYRDFVDKRCMIAGGNVLQIPLVKDTYDLVTAFETIYYWASLLSGVEEIYRVLKPGGTVVIANEMDGEGESDRQLEKSVGGIRIYTIDEIKEDLLEAGFTDITSSHDEQRHFICVMATKPS